MSYRRHLMMVGSKEYAVTRRKNPIIMAAIYAAGWSASPEHMTFKEAAAVTDIGTVFNNLISNNNHTSFEEFQYFTSVTNINANSFVGAWDNVIFPDSLLTIKGNIKAQYYIINKLVFPKNITYSTGYEGVVNNLLSGSVDGLGIRTVVWNGDKYPVGGFISYNSSPGVLHYTSDNPLYYSDGTNLWSADKTKLYLKGRADGNNFQFLGTETTIYDAFYGSRMDKLVVPSTITKFIRKYVTFFDSIITVLDMSACNVGADYPTAKGGTYRVIKMPTISEITTFGWLNGTKVSYLVFNQATPPQCTGNAANAKSAGLTTNSLVAIYVPDASVDTYKAAPGFSGYADKIKGLSEYDPTLENV